MKKTEDGFEYAGATWKLTEDNGLVAVDASDSIITGPVFLDNGRVTRRVLVATNRFLGAPASWTQSTIRSAVKIARQLSMPIANLLLPRPGAITAAEMGRLGGRSRSPAKAAAARANGAKGGRPRKRPQGPAK